jgi:hypothetical protein
MIPLALNGILCVAARVVTPAIGAWVAEVDIDLDLPVLPSGKATLVIGSTALVGTVDAVATGRFGAKASVRLVAGGGGWGKAAKAIHLHNDAGVPSTAVYSVTAAEVGEVVTELVPPERLGVDYARAAGIASGVFRGRSWWVDAAGVTFVGARLPRPQTPELSILSWDPQTGRAEIGTDEILIPGTILVDPRFGTLVVRDVEQTFTAGGARATAWCHASATASSGASGTILARALAAIAVEAIRPERLRTYRYRIVQQQVDKRVDLQVVSKASGAPEYLRSIEVWPGVAGVEVTFVPGTEVGVKFLDGDPSLPVVVDFAKGAPFPIQIKIGAGAQPIARATSVIAAIDALKAAVLAASAGLVAVTGTPSTPVAPLTGAHATAAATAATNVGNALAALTAAEAAIPSIRAFTD